jgi:transglutaminase-like putative cysteine protease
MSFHSPRTVLFVLTFLPFLLVGQTLDSLKKRFPDERLAFRSYHTTYEYFWSKEDSKLKVRQTDEVTLVPLKGAGAFSWPVFFHDELRVVSVDFMEENGKKLKSDKICGPYEAGGIFHSDARFCIYKVVRAEPGSVFKLKAVMEYDDPRYLTKVSFQEMVPGWERTIKLVRPEWVDVEAREFNFSGQVVRSEQVRDGKTEINYTVKKLLNHSGDQNSPHYSQYLPHIIFLTKSFSHPVSGEKELVLESTQDLYNWYRKLIAGTNDKPEELVELVNKLKEGKSDDDEIIKSIFYWVQDNIRYIAFENGIMGFQPEAAQSVFHKRYGDCKGMSNLLKNMLVLAGYDARITWVGTNILPYTYDLPSMAVDNHMVCALRQGDGFLILDPTAKYTALGEFADHIRGKQVMIQDEENYIIKEIPLADKVTDYERIQLKASIKDGALSLEGSMHLAGMSKQMLMYALNTSEQKDHSRILRRFVSPSENADIVNAKAMKIDRDEEGVVEVSILPKNKVNTFSDKLYVELEQRRDFESLQFKGRKVPYKFPGRRFFESVTILELPEGYQVSKLPEAYVVSTDNYVFDLSYTIENQRVIYTKKLHIFDSIIHAADFTDWNQAVKGLKEFYQKPIILIKQ